MTTKTFTAADFAPTVREIQIECRANGAAGERWLYIRAERRAAAANNPPVVTPELTEAESDALWAELLADEAAA